MSELQRVGLQGVQQGVLHGLLQETKGVGFRDAEDNENAEKEINYFCEHLFRHTQLQSIQLFGAGSRSEIEGQDLLFDRYGLSVSLLDQDIMFFNTNCYAFPEKQVVVKQFNGTILRIYSCNLHPGYVKLYDENNMDEFKRTNISPYMLGVLHGPADTFDTASFAEHLKELHHGLSVDTWNDNYRKSVPNYDRVNAVHCPYWPVQAKSWIARQKMYSSQQRSTIKEIVCYGCDFVQVQHKLSADFNVWRFSFSKAEIIIINSWSTSQRIVYRTFHLLYKIIKSRIDGISLCTYYFKTLMLWATEEKATDLWSEAVLASTVYELLFELMHLLMIGYLPNYFIPENNMIDHLPAGGSFASIEALYYILGTPALIANILKASRHVELHFSSRKYLLKAPMWVHLFLIVREQIDYSSDKRTQLFFKNFSLLLQHVLSLELSNIYHGLQFHKEADNCIIYSQKENSVLKGIEHFRNYLSSCRLQEIVTQHCSGTIANVLINAYYMEHKLECIVLDPLACLSLTADNISSNGETTDHKRLLFSRSVHNIDLTESDNNLKNIKTETLITLYTTTTIDNKTYNFVDIYKEFPKVSPTVNISWFIRKAYLVNLYYTVKHDYNTVEEICDNMIKVHDEAFRNQRFAEESFPVILSTECMPVFDKKLQAMLGLVSLCMFMFNKPDFSRSVYVGVCPILFALYLKCRCVADQLLIERWNKECSIAFSDHLTECKSDDRVTSGALLIHSVVKVVAESVKRLFLLRRLATATR